MPPTPPHHGPPDEGTHVAPRNFLTHDIPGTGGVIKLRPEDFLVEEIPLYEPAGAGEHIYLFIEKRGMSTGELVTLLANHFGVQRGAIGYAGLKDKLAITRQVISVHVPGRKIEDFPMIKHDKVGVLWSDYHANKLRVGHLRANRFSIRIRGAGITGVRHAMRSLARLAELGVPNRVGEQRFGPIGSNHLVGRALILGDYESALRHLLGPTAGDTGALAGARDAFARADYRAALEQFPRAARSEQAALRVLARGGDARAAVNAVDPVGRRFFVSAFQSAVFNAVLDDRLAAGTLGVPQVGDLAFKHDNRAVFSVDETTLADSAFAGRLARFEISPSGPLWGARMMRATGTVDAAEVDALERAGVSLEQLAAFDERTRGAVEGARRPLRVPVTDPAIEAGGDEHGEYIRCVFDLPRGAFATVVLREIIKPGGGIVDGSEEEPD